MLPTLDGGTPITDYLIERSADGTSEWLPIVDEVSPTRNATVTGLSNGTKVYFRVLAVSEVGTGLASTVVNATPRTVPDAPESLTATPSDGVIQLAWLAPASTGGSSITDYIVERSTDGTSGWVKIEELISSVRSFTVTGLVNGTRAYFRVLAVNEAGRSAASDVVDTVSRSVASPPQLLTAAPSNASGQVRLSWSVPASDGAAAITDYTIEHSPNGTSGWQMINDGVRTTTSHTVTGLSNGTRYYFRVSAVNAAGNSAFSNTSYAVPRSVADSSAFADGDADQPVWAGAPGVDRPVVPRWCRDHRLRDPTLDECHIMADDQRRRAAPRPPKRSPVCPTAPATTSEFLPRTLRAPDHRAPSSTRSPARCRPRRRR